MKGSETRQWLWLHSIVNVLNAPELHNLKWKEHEFYYFKLKKQSAKCHKPCERKQQNYKKLKITTGQGK